MDTGHPSSFLGTCSLSVPSPLGPEWSLSPCPLVPLLLWVVLGGFCCPASALLLTGICSNPSPHQASCLGWASSAGISCSPFALSAPALKMAWCVLWAPQRPSGPKPCPLHFLLQGTGPPGETPKLGRVHVPAPHPKCPSKPLLPRLMRLGPHSSYYYIISHFFLFNIMRVFFLFLKLFFLYVISNGCITLHCYASTLA